MPANRFEIEVRCDPGVAWDYLADLQNAPEWVSGAKASSLVAGSAREAGATYELRPPGSSPVVMRFELLEATRPQRIRARALSRSFEGEESFEIEPAGGGARVRYEMSYRMRGAFKLIAPLAWATQLVTIRRSARALRERLGRGDAAASRAA